MWRCSASEISCCPLCSALNFSRSKYPFWLYFLKSFYSVAMEDPVRLQKKLSSFWTSCCLHSTFCRWAPDSDVHSSLTSSLFLMLINLAPHAYLIRAVYQRWAKDLFHIIIFSNRRAFPVQRFSSINFWMFGTAHYSVRRSSACWATFRLFQVPVSITSTDHCFLWPSFFTAQFSLLMSVNVHLHNTGFLSDLVVHLNKITVMFSS